MTARPDALQASVAEIMRLLRIDLDRAEARSDRFTRAATRRGGASRGTASKLRGHIAFQRGRPQEALGHYERAARIFKDLGLDLELARVRLAAFNVLSRAGGQARARAWAEEARTIFLAHGDRLRAARLDANVATLLFRQDRVEESLRLGRRALRALVRLGATEDVAITQLNTAVRLTLLHRFPQALRLFKGARALCAGQGLVLLQVEVEGNLAYLHAQCGEYARALTLYREVRARAEAAGQDYLVTWLLLDEAELLLELNAEAQAVPLAEDALARCRTRALGYDAAKARTLLAIAADRQGRFGDALQFLDQARKAFESEENTARVALTELSSAVLLSRLGEFDEARRRAAQARATLLAAGLGTGAALADLVLARGAFARQDLDGASRHLRAARTLLRRYASPALDYQTAFLEGETTYAAGRIDESSRAYRRSHRVLEGLRSRLGVEELKVAFQGDKSVIYEAMARAALSHPNARGRVARSYGFVQQAKSRALADLLARSPEGTLTWRDAGSRTLQALRADINACHRAVERLQHGPGSVPRQRVARWRARAQAGEQRLHQALFDIRRRNLDLADLEGGGALQLHDVRDSLGDAVLIEYFDIRGTLHAYVVSRRAAAVAPLGPTEAVRQHVRLALFNLVGLPSPFRSQPRERTLEPPTAARLRALREALINPLQPWLDPGQPLLIAAHGSLHRLPFHALLGARYLGDEHPIALTPSGSVFALGRQRRRARGHGALVIGVADSRAPRIEAEARAVTACFGGAAVRLSARTSARRLRDEAAHRRVIHIAAHGLYRDENPLFSSIRLAHTRLDVHTLYEWRLCADLVTLSGCSTGVSFVAGGDELLGLTRGLLHAGAAAVHLSLWDVDDESTTAYMTAFYTHYTAGHSPAESARRAAADVRAEFPHPFHWAPFVVIGCGAWAIPVRGWYLLDARRHFKDDGA